MAVDVDLLVGVGLAEVFQNTFIVTAESLVVVLFAVDFNIVDTESDRKSVV